MRSYQHSPHSLGLWHLSLSLVVASCLFASGAYAEPPLAATRPSRVDNGEHATLPEGSKIDANGRLVDRTDYPFVNDPQAIGQWESVGFVERIDDFDAGSSEPKEKLFLKGMVFLNGGRTNLRGTTWTKGMVLDPQQRTASKYIIKEVAGCTYMFFEWKSGDYTVRHQKPAYYVLKKVSSDVGKLEWPKAFDDVRDCDLSELDLSAKADLLPTLNFNEKTAWPQSDRLPPGFDPARLMESAKNPGLGIRAIHKRGITGKGVNVAIIDQPLLPGHPEYKGKVAAYHDTGCQSRDSMHGPAVASLLVGEHCGTAPGARLYYAAAPSWLADAKFYADALDWIIAQNASLPARQKIRVVSISAAPSGRGSPFTKNTAMWDEACTRAAKAGILVIDCTRSPRGFVLPCFLDAKRPESPAACTPGFPSQTESLLGRLSGKSRWAFALREDCVFVPTSPRTPAEFYENRSPSYQYDGQGGLSWAIPYAAGVLALGWELRPDLQPDVMKRLLVESAHRNPEGLRIIDPAAFLLAVERAPQTGAAQKENRSHKRPGDGG